MNVDSNLNIIFAFKDLDERPKTIEDFAIYAKKTTNYKGNSAELEAKVNLIKTLLEVI